MGLSVKQNKGQNKGLYYVTILCILGGLLVFTISTSLVHAANQYYIAPNGTADGDGSIDHPWDIVTGLSGTNSKIKPGDTIWVRGGRYQGAKHGSSDDVISANLVGTKDNPVIVRAYPGERAIIDAWLQVGCCDQNSQPSKGAYMWFWGLEFASYNPNRQSGTSGPPEWAHQENHPAVDSWAPGTKLINNIVHDTSGGISMWAEAADSEAYGNIVYNIGGYGSDRGHGHSFYVQNKAPSLVNISDNIAFNNFDMGLQAYGSGDQAYVQNMHITGNIIFNSGTLYGAPADNLTIGGGVNGPTNITLENNYFYIDPSSDKGYNELGFLWTPRAGTAKLTGNYFIGGKQAIDLERWDSLVSNNNTAYSETGQESMLIMRGDQSTMNYNFGNNRYYGTGSFQIYSGCSNWPCPEPAQNIAFNDWVTTTGLDKTSTYTSGKPTGVWTFVRPNMYETGRANIAVYNWDNRGTVSADVRNTGIHVGDQYQIRDAQNYFGPPLASGTYDGNPIQIPMQSNGIALPVGSVPHPQSNTLPQFGSFVLLSGQALTGAGSSSNVVTPPAQDSEPPVSTPSVITPPPITPTPPIITPQEPGNNFTPSVADDAISQATWNLDSVSGNIVHDGQGNLNGSVVDTVTPVSGIQGQALQFNHGYIAVPHSSLFDLTHDLTLSVWIKTDSVPKTEAIISHYDATAGEYGYLLKILPDGHIGMRIGSNNLSSGNSDIIDTGSAINDGKWHLITAVIKLGQGVTFYHDGVQSSSASRNIVSYSHPFPLWIGLNNWVPFGDYFTGSMDTVSIDRRALSDAEIVSAYQSVTGAPQQSQTDSNSSSGTQSSGISFVQSKSIGDRSSGTQTSLGFDMPNKAGDLIVVVAVWSYNSTLAMIHDTQGNTYTSIGSVHLGADGWFMQLFYAKNIRGGSNAVTLVTGDVTTERKLAIHEYSGIDQSNPLDDWNAINRGGGTTAESSTVTARAGELVFSLDSTTIGVSSSGPGYILREARFFDGSGTEDMIQKTNGNVKAIFNQTTGSWGTEIAVFKPR